MSLLNPKNIDWNRLKSIHDQYRSTLRGIDADRRELIRLYPDLLKKRKEANLNRKTALETAMLLASKPQDALLASKDLLRPKEELLNIIEKEIKHFSQQVVSANGKEAISAALEKRNPNFK